jgi:hypothetical protein
LNQKTIGVAYVYFSDSDRYQQTADNIIACLLKQLVYQLQSLPPRVELAYDLSTKGIGSRNRYAFTELIMETATSFSDVYLLLDALDECSPDERSELMPCLQKLRNHGTKIFMTTRPHDFGQLKAFFKSSIHLPIQFDEASIQSIVEAGLADLAFLSLDDKKSILDGISAKSQHR